MNYFNVKDDCHHSDNHAMVTVIMILERYSPSCLWGQSPLYESPFHAPIFYCPETGSTMDDAHELIAKEKNIVSGTVLCAGFQTKGRGRFANRKWLGERDGDCLFTIILRSDKVPLIALPLRVGLALAEGLEMVAPELSNNKEFKPFVKWPNDIMIAKRKVAGILCEVYAGWVVIGIGVNCVDRNFSCELRQRAGSVSGLIGKKIAPYEVFTCVLAQLALHLNKNKEEEDAWRAAVEARLYRRDECVLFLIGDPNRNDIAHGLLTGLASDGRLVIELSNPTRIECFSSGELLFEDGNNGYTEPGA